MLHHHYLVLPAVAHLNILGITVTNILSVAEHVQDIIKLSSQTMHALRTLCSYGMSATVIQHVFWAVVVFAKLSYASQDWSGFTSAADLQRLNAFLCRSIRQGFCSPDRTDITVIFDAADEILFRNILSDGNHLLAPLLPNEVRTPYHLSAMSHLRFYRAILSRDKVAACNFIVARCDFDAASSESLEAMFVFRTLPQSRSVRL